MYYYQSGLTIAYEMFDSLLESHGEGGRVSGLWTLAKLM